MTLSNPGMTVFQIKRVETINYWLDFTREEVIELLSDHDHELIEVRESGEPLESLSDEALADLLELVADQYGDLHGNLCEQSERHGDVESNEFTVNLAFDYDLKLASKSESEVVITINEIDKAPDDPALASWIRINFWRAVAYRVTGTEKWTSL